ncbi:MAG: class I SAM-dependent methyltransferase [Eggerthellaceae bacterium]
MNESFARALCQLNNRFYQEQAASFSNTRQAAWPGWERCLEHIADHLALNTSAEHGTKRPFSILDVACGNLRFEEFLTRSLPQGSFAVTALDACDDLLPEEPLPNVRYRHCDIIDALLDGTLSSALRQEPHLNGPAPAALASTSSVSTIASPAPTSSALASPEPTPAALAPEHHLYDCVVSFGFMHHVPGTQWRERFLDTLIDATEPGGLICLSLWRFMDNEALAEKARRTHNNGTRELSLDATQFEPGDYLVGWKNKLGAYRYCHSFIDSEIDALLASTSRKAECLARFRADGRSDNLNEYLILRKTH